MTSHKGRPTRARASLWRDANASPCHPRRVSGRGCRRCAPTPRPWRNPTAAGRLARAVDAVQMTPPIVTVVGAGVTGARVAEAIAAMQLFRLAVVDNRPEVAATVARVVP